SLTESRVFSIGVSPMPRHALFVPLVLALALIAIDTSATEPAPPPRPAGAKDIPVADVAKAVSGSTKVDAIILGEVKEHSQLMANLRHLSDIIGQRLTGSKNLQRANEWTAERMKEYGLENVKLEPWEIPSGWERGPATFKLVEPDNGRQLTV